MQLKARWRALDFGPVRENCSFKSMGFWLSAVGLMRM
jgi:hypothetical protein